MRVGCVIQARTGSTRLPGKIHMLIGDKPMLWHLETRLAALEPIFAYPEDFDCPEDDVLARYTLCARRNALDVIMRVTGDCPLIDPKACQRVLKAYCVGLHDYVANDMNSTVGYPRGMGCEVFSRECLEWTHKLAEKAYDREHVSPFMKRANTFSKLSILCPVPGVQDINFSVDTQEDLDFVRAIDAAKPRDFTLEATVEAYHRVQAQAAA
jgi:spore coat polysaccharide biosynthesis protein SpsF (cytidylyltransferase family)